MPKPRADLQVVAWRVDLAVESGSIAALPIHPRAEQITSMGKRPSVLLVLESFRLRYPLVNVTGSKIRRQDDPENWNRMTIRPCLLVSRWVPVSVKAPDFAFLVGASAEQRKDRQVFASAKGLRRRIYQVVTDPTHGLRQTRHIAAQYELEQSFLVRVQKELEDHLAQARSGLIEVTQEDQFQTLDYLRQVTNRLVEIRNISIDRAAREDQLLFFVRRSHLELVTLARSLENFQKTVGRMGALRYEAIAEYLTGFNLELAYYSSQETRAERQAAQRAIRDILRYPLALTRDEILALLAQATTHLYRASVNLGTWSINLERGEDALKENAEVSSI